MLQLAANLHIKAKNYTIAQKLLKDAEHILNQTKEEVIERKLIPVEIK